MNFCALDKIGKDIALMVGRSLRDRRAARSENAPYRCRGGFTIVEMLVVVAIIAILAGAITMGVNGMFYKSRVGRAKAMRAMLQSGLETFYARTGEWPSPIKDIADNNKGGQDEVVLTADKADRCFYEIV